MIRKISQICRIRAIKRLHCEPFVPASYGDVFRGFFLAAGNNTLFRINR
jgi:hypothetical protein